MGYFTWTFANRKTAKLPYEGKGYIACPDGTFIEEPCYEGFGFFNNYDIFELVVDWNRNHLKGIFEAMEKAKKLNACELEAKEVAIAAMDGDEAGKAMAAKVYKAYPPLHTNNWKRNLGSTIAFSGYAVYPIKIVSNKKKKYDELPASVGCQ